MFELLHTWELGLLEQLQHFRTPARDYFFTLLDFFDTDYFYFFLLPIVWAIFGKRWGVRVLYLILLSAVINADLKDLFAQPRPLQIDPTLGLLNLTSYGFPSGAAQSTLILAGLGMIAMPRVIPILVFLSYLLLISFSRIYLGAHFMTDIIGGWAIGLALLFAYIKYHARLEKWADGLSMKGALLASCIIPMALLMPHITVKTIIYSSFLLGINLGLWLSHYVSGTAMQPLFSWQKQFAYILLTVGGIFFLSTNTRLIFPSFLTLELRYCVTFVLIGLWFAWGVERLLSLKKAPLR